MESGDAIQLVILVILLGLSAFFSSAETALTTVNKIRIRSLIDEGNKRAAKVGKILDNPGKMLSAVLIGNNIVNIGASSLATVLATKLFGSSGAGIATGVLTLLILIFGEITPKSLATLYSEKLSLFYAGIILFLMNIFTPIIIIVNKLSHGLLLLLHIDPAKKVAAMTESELRTIVDVSHEEGVLESEEHSIIQNLFDFGDAQAKDVMIPRIDMVLVDINATYDELLSIFEETRYTRFPVYENTTDNVIGIINMKDILLYKSENKFAIRDFLREAYYTYEHKNLSELMLEMRKTSVNIVIVLDEYGATSGLITLEDLLEEIVGEIRDEYDADEEQSTIRLNDSEYLIEGHMRLDDLNDMLGTDYESEDYDSVGGFIIGRLDRLPKEGDSITIDNIRLVVETLDINRIEKVHVYIEPTQDVPPTTNI